MSVKQATRQPSYITTLIYVCQAGNKTTLVHYCINICPLSRQPFKGRILSRCPFNRRLFCRCPFNTGGLWWAGVPLKGGLWAGVPLTRRIMSRCPFNTGGLWAGVHIYSYIEGSWWAGVPLIEGLWWAGVPLTRRMMSRWPLKLTQKDYYEQGSL